MALQIQKKFIGNDQVDGEKILLAQGQAVKAKDSSGVEQDLIKLGVSDEVLVKGQEVALKATVDQEVVDRIAGDSALDGRLTTAEGTISTHGMSISTLQFDLDAAELAISNEVMRATGVESGIDSRLITAEGEINVLQFDLDAAELAISNEVMRATGVEFGIDSRLTTAEGEINVLQFDLDANELALANEVMRATGVENGLDSRLFTAENEINTLQFDLDANEMALGSEIMRATAVEMGLDSRLVTAEGEIDILQAELNQAEIAIFQEISDRNAAIAAQAVTEEALRNAADANLQSQIDAISGGGSGSISALQSEVDATQAGAGLDSAGAYVSVGISGNYIGSSTSIHGATVDLDSALKVEETARIADVSDLQGQIDNVLSNVDGAALDSLTEIVTAFQAADASLNGAITALSTGLSADIDTEEAARIAADSALQGEIDAEEIARAAADTTLQTNINSEASARISADNALDTRVDALEAVAWFKESFSISDSQTSVTFTHAPKSNSVVAFVDRLAIHQSSDYSVSGTTMTFMGDLVAPGQSELGNGDTVYVTYQYVIV